MRIKYLTTDKGCFTEMKKLILIALLACLPATSQATLIFFGEDLAPSTSKANSEQANTDFSASLIAAGTEDFESFSSGQSGPLTIDFGIAGTATLSGNGEIRNSPGYGRFATSGTNYWNTNNNFTIEFSNAISAFGFYGTDIGDINGQITLEFLSGATTNITVDSSLNAPNGSLLFWGIIDNVNPFTKITFGTTNSSDVFGFDDMTIAVASQVVTNPIPEPTTLAVFALGFLGLRARQLKK